jgi:hypothetical protein
MLYLTSESEVKDKYPETSRIITSLIVYSALSAFFLAIFTLANVCSVPIFKAIADAILFQTISIMLL